MIDLMPVVMRQVFRMDGGGGGYQVTQIMDCWCIRCVVKIRKGLTKVWMVGHYGQ